MSKNKLPGVEAALARMLTTLEKKVDPSHTALVVVDVQNDFCAEGGLHDKQGLNLSLIQDMVPNLVSFIDRAREAGVTVIFIQNLHDAFQQCYYVSDVFIEQCNRRGGRSYTEYPVCEPGSWEAEFYDGIKPLPGEIVVAKHRFSAFIDTELDLILRSKGIRTLILTGVSTSVCVESTARDGFMKDYYIVLPRDCTAEVTAELHNNTLKIIDRFFGQVVNSADVLKCWKK